MYKSELPTRVSRLLVDIASQQIVPDLRYCNYHDASEAWTYRVVRRVLIGIGYERHRASTMAQSEHHSSARERLMEILGGDK